MATLGYLEVLDHKGRVSQRFPVQSLPLTLGRAYTNHVIVDDPFVCPEHLTIGYDENGRLRGARSWHRQRTARDCRRQAGAELASRLGHANSKSAIPIFATARPLMR